MTEPSDVQIQAQTTVDSPIEPDVLPDHLALYDELAFRSPDPGLCNEEIPGRLQHGKVNNQEGADGHQGDQGEGVDEKDEPLTEFAGHEVAHNCVKREEAQQNEECGSQEVQVGSREGLARRVLQQMEMDDSSDAGAEDVSAQSEQEMDASPEPTVALDLRKGFECDPIEWSEAELAGHRRLDFRPIQIRTWFLLSILSFFLTCIGSIVAVLELSRKSGGTLNVETPVGHLAFRYVPAIMGTVTTLWWRTIVTTFSRISVYVSMAANKIEEGPYNTKDRRVQRTLHADYADALFEPDVWYLPMMARNGHWLLFVCVVASIIVTVSLVGLKAVLIQVTPTDNGWNIAISEKIALTTFSIYILLIVLTLTLLIRLWSRDTGLKWDPTSVADQLTLMQGSNLGALFDGLDTCSPNEYRQVLRDRAPDFGSLRLGYWKHRTNGSIWHGIAFAPETSGQSNMPCSDQGQDRRDEGVIGEENRVTMKDPTLWRVIITQQTLVHHDGIPVSNVEALRYRAVNFFLYDSTLAIYITVAVGILVCLGIWYPHLQQGIRVTRTFGMSRKALMNDGQSTNYGYSVKEGFLFRFLPTNVMGWFFGTLWLNADYFYRHRQPFAGMYDASPASANLLLDYPGCLPVVATIKAILNKHWRVALFSLLSLMATAPPIVASGIFVGTPDATGLTVHIQPFNFWATVSILGVYVLCMPFAGPTPAYRLPRGIYTTADLLLFCYTSRALDDEVLGKPIFSAQDPTDERVHLESRIHLAKQNYQFGLYLGKDGRRHLGFDIAERQDASGRLVYVDKVDPGRALYFGFGTWYFRRPRIVRKLE